MKILNSLQWIVFCLAALPAAAFAFLTVGESAEVVPTNVYRLGAGAQMRLSNGSGANVVGSFDMAANEEASYRLQMGFGETDFFVVNGSINSFIVKSLS